MNKLFVSAFALFSLICSFPNSAQAEIRKEVVEYEADGVVLEGYLAYEDTNLFARPGIVVVHEWNGLGDFVKQRCEQLAKEGYVAFGADIYGKGIRPKNMEESAKEAGIYKKNRALMRSRALAAVQELRKHRLVDASRMAVIGFCFGGTTALEVARSGADLQGFVSFHGGLDTPDPTEAKNIKGKILVLHGAVDPYVKDEEVASFETEMNTSRVDWLLVKYGGAVHGFTNPYNGNDVSKGAAYNEAADKRSWSAMKIFFNEIFK